MRLRGRLLTLVAVGVLVPSAVKAQSSVIMRAAVSETVTISVPPVSIDGVEMSVVSSGGTVRIMLSGSGAKSQIIRLPLLVRSNTSFKISALFESNTAELSQLLVADAQPTGTLVSPQVVNALKRYPHVDPNTSQPWLVLSGPRVSFGGTLNSPNNALQINMLIRLSPQPDQPWTAQLNLVATKQL